MFTVDFYTTPDGSIPVADWLESLGDNETTFRIVSRLNRITAGSFGGAKTAGEGVWELRFHFGPGYRVYYARVGLDGVLLLCGGNKSSQKRDISAAKRHLAQFKGRTK